ncbi:MAG: GNAT family N-acetyltransferase [Acidimicrobiia bacterium]|nr:GNAT family N-acetyltransferase [Acidimicrobiia bacterium]
MDTKARARHDPDNSRYVVEVDGEIVGYTEYHLRGPGIHFFYHTEIAEEYEGRGVGSVLVRFALDDVRSKGQTIVPLCPFVAAWLGRHPEYNDIVNQRIMERLVAQEE